MNDNVSALLGMEGENSESGGGAVSSVNGQTGAVFLDYEDVGAAQAETTVTVSGATPTIQAADNTLYLFSSAVTSITVSSLPESGLFELVFLSGSTATEIIGPAGQSISLAEGCEIAADKVNDVSIRVCSVGGVTMALATVGTWEAPAAEEEST